ncbi:MAG: cytochrome D ubiquinol oxidase subunit II [Pirellulaceae bacterium]|nr:MAG: cytochrome D ubiquinol oxidase subunit II [Pirellulaceae bacterium]GIW95165.1 MAG: cytochrome D ubiquinol oxidase subunit II [Pirellulaceae bacterium]
MAPEVILLLIVWLALALYVLLGGADFGAGIWEVNLAFQTSEKERLLLHRALGPVWEANHVWLIFVLVVLFNGFPPAFAALSRALWLPLSLALVGIVFRGAAFAFRVYSVGATRQQLAWGVAFAVASTMAPFFLGAAAGAMASGNLAVTPDGRFTGDYLFDWLSPLAIFTGFFTVGVCAYLAAVYLAREATIEKERDLAELWRQRALATGIWMGVLSVSGLVFLAIESPLLWHGFQKRAWPLVIVSLVTGFASLEMLRRRHYTTAICGVAATVGSVLAGWGVAQYPALVLPSITIYQAKAPEPVLWAMLGSILIGTLILVPSLVWLFVLFKRPYAKKQS